MSQLPLSEATMADLGCVPRGLFHSPSVAVAAETGAEAGAEAGAATGLWVSSSGSTTPLRFDHCHSVICQLVGRKRVTCFAPCDSSGLYPFPHGQGNVRTSRVDLWTWRFGSGDARAHERRMHPAVASATPLETVRPPLNLP